MIKNDYIITGGMLQATAFLNTFKEYPPSQPCELYNRRRTEGRG